MGGKVGQKRVVRLRGKWGEIRDRRGEAASTSGEAARNRLPGFRSFSSAAPKFTYLTTCRNPINPTNQRADGKMKPSRLQSWREKVTGGWLSKHIQEIRGVFAMAAKADTPKKPVKGEKLLSSRHTKTSINDNCRLCSCQLKIKYGEFQKTSYISTQNLFKISKREGCHNVTLAELSSKIGLKIDRSDMFSDRVCHACGRKIRNAVDLYNFIRSKLEKEKEATAIEGDGDSVRLKRLLPTTVSSPDRSPLARKGRKTSEQCTGAKKSLTFNKVPPAGITSNKPNEILKISPQEASEIASSNLNVEDLLESTTTEVKVVIVNPSGRIETFSSFQDNTKSMIANLCRKRWKTVANLAFAHPNVRVELVDPLRKTVGREFQEYCNNATDSLLKKSRPEDLAAFSNKVLVHEAGVWCPFWMNCVKGACNVQNPSEPDIKKTNSMALITSVAARGRNPTMSAVAYRISAILCHSGVKYDDQRLLNKLGVCMSPDMIVEFQRKMGESCESKVCHWKKEIEKVKVASLLLNEVREKQVGHHEDEIMRVQIDFSEKTIEKYNFFEPSAFKFCQENLHSVCNEKDVLTDQDLEAAAAKIAHVNLPYYRYLCCNRNCENYS